MSSCNCRVLFYMQYSFLTISASRALKCCSALSLRCCSFSFSLALASSAWLALTSRSRSRRLASILPCFSFSFSLSAFSFCRSECLETSYKSMHFTQYPYICIIRILVVHIMDYISEKDSEFRLSYRPSYIEAPISGHPWEAEQVSATGAGRVWIASLEFKQGFVKAAVQVELYVLSLLPTKKQSPVYNCVH